MLAQRLHLGTITPNRRNLFDISTLTRQIVPSGDHLCVAHRVPSNLLDQVNNVEEHLELEQPPDYYLYRSLVEYSYPQGGNGSVIYETPPALKRYESRQATFRNAVVFFQNCPIRER